MQKASNPLQNFKILQSFATHLLLLDQRSGTRAVYKEFRVPEGVQFEAFYEQLNCRRRLRCANVLEMHLFLFEQASVAAQRSGSTAAAGARREEKFGLLYEAPQRDFQSEISKRIAAALPWSEEELINTIELVALGVHELHSAGLVHGDLRAKSIVFCDDKNVKVADQFVSQSMFKKNLQELLLSEAYLAPEELQQWCQPGAELGSVQRSATGDLWSLGLLFLEASVLKRSSTIYKQSNGDNKCLPTLDTLVLENRLQEVRTKHSKRLEAILRCLLSFDTEKRYEVYTLLGLQESDAQTEVPMDANCQDNVVPTEEESQVQQQQQQQQLSALSYEQDSQSDIVARTSTSPTDIPVAESAAQETVEILDDAIKEQQQKDTKNPQNEQENGRDKTSLSCCSASVVQEVSASKEQESFTNEAPNAQEEQTSSVELSAEQAIPQSICCHESPKNNNAQNIVRDSTIDKMKKMDEIVRRSSQLVAQIRGQMEERKTQQQSKSQLPGGKIENQATLHKDLSFSDLGATEQRSEQQGILQQQQTVLGRKKKEQEQQNQEKQLFLADSNNNNNNLCAPSPLKKSDMRAVQKLSDVSPCRTSLNEYAGTSLKAEGNKLQDRQSALNSMIEQCLNKSRQIMHSGGGNVQGKATPEKFDSQQVAKSTAKCPLPITTCTVQNQIISKSNENKSGNPSDLDSLDNLFQSSLQRSRALIDKTNGCTTKQIQTVKTPSDFANKQTFVPLMHNQ